MTYINKFSKQILTGFAIMAIFVAALYFAQMLSESAAIVSLVEKFGYLGVLLTGIVAGLNTFVPLPAATFTPLFISAGLSIPMIIFVLAAGTLIADGIGFALGHVSRELIQTKYPKIFDFFTELATEKTKLILPIVILYASFVPFPNEAILIPLALAGVSFKKLLIPLMLGNIIHQALFVYSIAGATSFVF